MDEILCREDADKLLEKDELWEWVKDTIISYYGKDMPVSDINHVNWCMKSLIKALFYEEYDCGAFIHAVLMNDLVSAFGGADEVNQKYLRVYCVFIYNFIVYSALVEYRRAHDKSRQKAGEEFRQLVAEYLTLLLRKGLDDTLDDFIDNYPTLSEYFNIEPD